MPTEKYMSRLVLTALVLGPTIVLAVGILIGAFLI
jgi:hypothetical protein